MARHRASAPPVRVLRTAPWRRAPLLLLRRPVVFVGIAVATAVLAVAASAGVLFASTLGTASLKAQAADDCPERSMPTYTDIPQPGDLDRVNAAGVAATRAARVPGSAYWVDLTGTFVQSTQVTLFSRRGALQHVTLLTPDHGQRGAWFPDDFAAKLGAKPGDDVDSNFGSIHVAGIYRSLSPDPFHLANLPRYWCNWAAIIVQKVTSVGAGTPPLLIADPGTVARVAAAYNGDTVTVSGLQAVATGVISTSWYVPLPLDAMNLDAVQRAADRAGRADAYLRRDLPAGAVADRYFVQAMLYGPQGAPTPMPLLDKIQRAKQVQAGLAGSVLPISLAGALVALLLVAEAGGSWAARRAREVRLLTTRGVGPAAIALKACLETLPPALVGLGIGYGLSYLLMRTLGPTPVFGAGAPARAAWLAAAAVLAGLVLVAAVGALSARQDRAQLEPRRYRRAMRHLPFELLLVAGGAWAWLTIRSGHGIAYTENIVDVHPLLLIFPLLALTGVVLLLGRGAALLVPRLGAVARRLPASGYLALRRIGGSRAIAVGLLLGTALPCGLLAYAGTVSVGVHDELVRKYQTNLGAPHVLELIGVHHANPDLAGHGTAVVLYQNGPTLPGGAPVTVMGIDPATFDRFAYLDDQQRTDARRLAADGNAAVLVYADGGQDPTQVHLGQTALPVHVVARSPVFPGLRAGFQPMLVVNRNALAHVDPDLDRINEAWTTDAQVEPVSRAIQHDGYSVISEFDAKIRVSNSGLLPITWIFGYLRALAILIGAVATTGLVFALSARTRRRTVSYVMSRRMGLTHGTHIRSLLLELLAIVGLGWVAGTGAGLAGYAVLTGSLDLQPQLPPGAQFVLPVLSLVATAATVSLVITLAAAGTHAAAERARPADILRLE